MNIVVLITLIACIIYLTYGQNHQNNKISYTIIISLLFLCVLYLCGNIYENYKELITYGIVFLVLLFCIVYVYSPKIEGMTSEEALKNVASIYNSDNMVVKNLKVTGDLEVSGKSKIPNVNGNATISGNLITKTLSVSGTSKIPKIEGNANITGTLVVSQSAQIPKIDGSISIPNINGNVNLNGDCNVSQTLNCQRVRASGHIYGKTIAGCIRHFDQQGQDWGGRKCNLVYTLNTDKSGDKLKWMSYETGNDGETIGNAWDGGNDINIKARRNGCSF
jgi:Ca2+/Na+ antiporter